MWTVKLEEMCMQFLMYPGFTEESIQEKILSDNVIFMEEAVYNFVMFATENGFKNAIEEVSEGLEFPTQYIFECNLAAISEDGEVVLLFKPEEEYSESVELTGEFKSKVFPDLLKSIGLTPKTEKEEDKEEDKEEPSEDDWDGWL